MNYNKVRFRASYNFTKNYFLNEFTLNTIYVLSSDVGQKLRKRMQCSLLSLRHTHIYQ